MRTGGNWVGIPWKREGVSCQATQILFHMRRYGSKKACDSDLVLESLLGNNVGD